MTTEPLSVIRSRAKAARTTEYTTAPSASQEPTQQQPEPFLSYRGGVHWYCTDCEALISLLRQSGFIDLATEQPIERARLWHPFYGCIVVKWHDWLAARGQAMAFLESLRKVVR